MASKTVSQLKIKLGLENSQVFDKLRGSFRQLEKTVGVTDKGIEELRDGLKQYGSETIRSTQSLQGQIEAFKGLQRQAKIGGAVYKKLTKDIQELTKSLSDLESQYDDTAKKARSLAQQEGVFAAKTGDKITNQFAARRKMLAGLSVGSREYATLLARQTIQEDAYTRALSRQRVIAAAARTTRLGIPGQGAMDMSTEAVRAYYMRGVGDLPDTTAALSLRLSELQTDLVNVTRGGETYNIISKEMSRVQRELNKDLDQNANSYAGIAAKLRLVQTQTTAAGNGFLEFSQRATSGAAITEAAVEKSIARQRAKRAVYSYERPFTGTQIQPTRSAAELMRVGGQRRASRQPLGAGGYAQVAGAALSGGIFGGPEGAGGALLGGVLGGVPGAFAGAAAGAQVSMARQSLGGAADYAAQIGKLKIALEGVAGSQEDYQRALRSAADVTQRLNVPQETAVAGMTRLTAAVKGAGGEVDDASLVFKNVTAAIKATGGGAQDVQSAITAMVQVFSKGKVSAEELSGQLGERLPGAVTLFAKANDMTLPELQKALKAGTVGLNELMNFIEELGVKYGKTANDIAKSNEEAGARLSVALKALQLEVGQSLLPIGAQLQDAFAEFIKNVTPSLVKAVENLGKGIKFLIENASNIKTIAEFAATFALVNLATKAFIAMNGPLQTAFLAIQAGFGATSQQAIVAQMKISAAAASLKAFALAAAAPIGITIVLFGLQKLIQARMELARLKQQAGAGAKEVFAGATRETVVSAQEKQKSYLPTLEKDIAGLEKDYKDLQKPGLAQIGAGGVARLELIKGALDRKRLELQFTKDVLSLDPKQYSSLQEELKRTKYDPIQPEGSGDKEKSKDFTRKEAELRLKLIAAQEKGVGFAAAQAKYNLDMYLAIKDSETPEKNRVAKAEAYKNFVQAIAGEMKGVGNMQMEENKRLDDINRSLEDRKYKLGLINEEQYKELQIEREKKRLEKLYQGPAYEDKRAEALDLFRQEIDPTPFQEMKQNIAQLKQELTDLLNPVNQITGAANAIGTAFSQSFASVINGSATTQEALAGFFRNVSNYFLEMASQIITKMITLAILNTVVGLLPGGGSLGGVTGATPGAVGSQGFSISGSLLAANGAAFDKGLKRYAMGGIVDKPTMFAYANGGTGRFGLMGEAGPEAIMPLKRGADGKLGVAGGGGVNVGAVNITVENTGEQLTPAAQKQIANQVQGIVMATLVNERRSGGVLR